MRGSIWLTEVRNAHTISLKKLRNKQEMMNEEDTFCCSCWYEHHKYFASNLNRLRRCKKSDLECKDSWFLQRLRVSWQFVRLNTEKWGWIYPVIRSWETLPWLNCSFIPFIFMYTCVDRLFPHFTSGHRRDTVIHPRLPRISNVTGITFYHLRVAMYTKSVTKEAIDHMALMTFNF